MQPQPGASPAISSVIFETALLPTGWAQGVKVDMRDGVIAAVTLGETGGRGIGLPGVANLHSHAFQRGLAGLAEYRGGSDSFWTWRDVMYRFLTRLTPDDVEAIAALAFAEMLEAGFTRVGEFHYLHHDVNGQPYANPAEMAERIAAAAAQIGIGLTLLPVLYERGGFDGRAPNPAQRRFCSSLDLFSDLLERCDALARPTADPVGIAPHSLRAVSQTSLRALAPLMKDRPVHIHIAEQRQEVADCLAATGAPPVRWLLDHVAVDSRWCLIHATHTEVQEVQALATSGAVVGLCPISEANLGDGLFKLGTFQEADGRLGIGTDSHIELSLFGELRLLEYGQRLAQESRNVTASTQVPSTGRSLFEAALQGGAQALGVKTGIQVGSPADFFAVDPSSPLFIGRSGDKLLDSLIFCGGNGLVSDVWRAGRKVVSDGRHICKDAILSRYRDMLGRFLAQ